MKKVLVIVAHADDAELSVGNFMQGVCEEGGEVKVVVVTGGDNPMRRQESLDAGEVLGVSAYEVWSYTDGRLENEIASLQQQLEKEIQQFVPTMVVTHFAHDIHTDHRALAEAVEVAARGVRKLVAFKSPGSQGFTPNFFYIASSAQQAKKRAALRLFVSQKNVIAMLDDLDAYSRSCVLHFLPPHYLMARRKELGDELYFEPLLILRWTSVCGGVS